MGKNDFRYIGDVVDTKVIIEGTSKHRFASRDAIEEMCKVINAQGRRVYLDEYPATSVSDSDKTILP